MKTKILKFMVCFVLFVFSFSQLIPVWISVRAEDNPAWSHLSEEEKNMGLATYDKATDTIHFPTVDAGWGARMLNTALDLSGKNWALEFDVALAGGELAIYPTYEDALHFAGIGLDFGSQSLDGIVVNDTILDDFSFREATTAGATVHTTVPATGLAPTGHIKVEFRNGTSGSLAGGTASVYQKATGATDYTKLGTYTFGNNIVDTATPNRLLIQLWLGTGSISNIAVTELTKPAEPEPKWMHISDAEQGVGDIRYNEETDTIILTGAQEWSSRLINTEIKDISGKNFAVEFDSDLGSGGAIGITPFFEDAVNFYGVYYDIAAQRLDGVGIMGIANNALQVIDDFSYINSTLYPDFPIRSSASTGGSNVRIRAEFFLGRNGTMAGGMAYYYYKEVGQSTWNLLGKFLMPDTIVDHEDIPNRIMIHGRLTNGTLKNIEVLPGITNPIVPDSQNVSKNWGYASQYDEIVNSASFDDTNGIMTLKAGGSSMWDTRMVCLTVPDVTGKNFALEFKADLLPGGALGVIPFFENPDNWYGVYLDRGALLVDGVGYKNGSILDNFAYVDDTLYSSQRAENAPFIGQFQYRFEYFSAEDGTARGATCKLFYKMQFGTSAKDNLWRLIGTFTMPDTIADHVETKNKIAIHARLLSGTLSDISFTEISSDTVTEYYQPINTDEEAEDGYPDDSYTPSKPISSDAFGSNSANQYEEQESTVDINGDTESFSSENETPDDTQNNQQKVITQSKKITEYGDAPWWSFLLMGLGGVALIATVILVLKFGKNKV